LHKQTAAAFVVVACSSACVATAPTRMPDGKPVEVRMDSNDTRFFSESLGRYLEPGEFVTFEGYFHEGEKLPDELDFYAIVDDKERLAQIVAWREAHNRGIIASWTGVGVGAGLVAGGVGIWGVTGNTEGDKLATFIATPLGQVSTGLIAGGGIVLGAAGLLGYGIFGPKQDLQETGTYDPGILFPVDEAMTVAGAYNATLTSTSP
jgi:hypothetical protein